MTTTANGSSPIILDEIFGYFQLEALLIPYGPTPIDGQPTVNVILAPAPPNKDAPAQKGILCYNHYSFTLNQKTDPFPRFTTFFNDEIRQAASKAFDANTAASGCLGATFALAPIFGTLFIGPDQFQLKFTYPKSDAQYQYIAYDSVTFTASQSANKLWSDSDNFFLQSDSTNKEFYFPFISTNALNTVNIFTVTGQQANYVLGFELYAINDISLFSQYSSKYDDPATAKTAIQKISGQQLCKINQPTTIIIPIFANRTNTEAPAYFLLFDPNLQTIPYKSFQLITNQILSTSMGTASPFQKVDDVSYFIFGFCAFNITSVQNAPDEGFHTKMIMGYASQPTNPGAFVTCDNFGPTTSCTYPCVD